VEVGDEFGWTFGASFGVIEPGGVQLPAKEFVVIPGGVWVSSLEW
jgi:hypothetical protein